ncbi:MAG TPA: hypothetical protein VN692_05220 [Steroidobacteraceae bacterium]|nr:hypothetical protein [Steroidobacteraceae bacterium]
MLHFLILRGSAAAATVLLAATPWGAAPANADAADCASANKATLALQQIPNHQYVTSVEPGSKGEPITMEIITLTDAKYMGSNGNWTKSSFNSQQAVREEQERIDKSMRRACRFLRDESVHGEPTAVYSVHDETPGAKSDTQIWVAKRNGLPVKLETDVTFNGTSSKTHISDRIDLDNVKAPSHFSISAAG